MKVIHKLRMDLARCGCRPILGAVQGEANTRVLEVDLYDNGIAWEIPSTAVVDVAYQKPDGTKGIYSKLPDGTKATTFSGNVLSATIAPQMVTCAGTIRAAFVFSNGGDETLATFPFTITVESNPAAGAERSEDYFNPKDISDLRAEVAAHAGRKDNPHGVTLAQIGAAPASGFESYYSVSTDAELNAKIAELTEAQPAKTEKTYGFYLYYTSDNDLPTGAMSVTIHKHSSTDASVTATSFYNRVLYLHRELYNGTWKEWEWENPPMAHGRSYRTTEKLDNGKAVYTRLVNCGEAVNGKKTTISGAGDINIIRYEGTIGGRSLPYIYATMDNAMSAWVCISSYSIYLYCGSSQVGNNYSVQIWYTKDNE